MIPLTSIIRINKCMAYRKEGVQYYVAGAGALTDKLGSKASDGNLVWAGAGYSAFAAVAATQETLTVNFVNIYGEDNTKTIYLLCIKIVPEEESAFFHLFSFLSVRF